MTKTEEYALKIKSLSIYKGILYRSVPKQFLNLLEKSNSLPSEFLSAWGDFFALLCEKGCQDNLCTYITKAALYDENSFSKAAASDKLSDLPESIISAAQRDISIIVEASLISPQQILNDYKYKEEIKAITDTLPIWRTGQPLEQMADIDSSVSKSAEFYRQNGCGMFARYKAFIWRDGSIHPVLHPDSVTLEDLKGYSYARNLVINNTRAFLNGQSANNCLLYGDKGTGKSSTVKAILNEYFTQGLRIVEMPKERLCDFPLLIDKIAMVPMKFILYIDDLSFQTQDESYTSLKAVLEGGLAARPENTLIYATSNRRHIVKENFSDRDGGELHRNDQIQESLSLADRFGLSVNFSAPSKQDYLDIVAAIASQRGVEMEQSELFKKAESWALDRGGRSARCARQFIDSLFVNKS
ncbi:MAG: ATP-binding protein [Acutalibacteraceae bacterium]